MDRTWIDIIMEILLLAVPAICIVRGAIGSQMKKKTRVALVITGLLALPAIHFAMTLVRGENIPMIMMYGMLLFFSEMIIYKVVEIRVIDGKGTELMKKRETMDIFERDRIKWSKGKEDDGNA